MMSNPNPSSGETPKKDVPNPEPPKLDAILPDDPPIAHGEVLGHFDDYQRKVESEWESAKEAYHQKIDQMMEEFLKETLPKDLNSHPDEMAAPPPPRQERPQPSSSKRTSDPAEAAARARLEALLSRAQHNLPRGRPSPFLLDHGPARRFSLRWFASLADRWRSQVWIGLSLALSLAMIWPVASRFRPPSIGTLPYKHATGPQIVNEKIYVADWLRKALFVHDLEQGLPIVAVENVPNAFITGFALTDKRLWTVDGFNGKILQHTLEAEHPVTREISTPGPKPVGLSWDGTDLWTGDAQTKMIYRHHGTDPEEVIESFELPRDIGLTSIQVKAKRFWVLDGKSRELLVFRQQSPARLLQRVDLDSVLKEGMPSGLFVDEKNAWIVTENPSTLQRVPLRNLIGKPLPPA